MPTFYQEELNNVIQCFTPAWRGLMPIGYTPCTLENRGKRLVICASAFGGEGLGESASAITEVDIFEFSSWQRAWEFFHFCLPLTSWGRWLLRPLIVVDLFFFGWFLIAVWFVLSPKLVRITLRSRRGFQFLLGVEPRQIAEAIRKLQSWELDAKFRIQLKSGRKRPLPSREEDHRPSTTKRRPAKKQPVWMYGLAGVGVFALCCVLCCGGLMMFGYSIHQEEKRKIAEADELWDNGDKAEAVSRYKSALLRSSPGIEMVRRPALFQQVIEYEVERGETSSARQVIEKALDARIPLSLHLPSAKKLEEEVRRDRETKRR